MGTEQSKCESGDTKKQPLDSCQQQRIDPHAIVAFEALASGRQSLAAKDFTEKFGENFGSDLWKYLSDGASEKYSLDVAHFSKHLSSLIGVSNDRFLEVLLPAENVVRVCAESAGVRISDDDEPLLANIVAEMEKAGGNIAELAAWKNQCCPRLCCAAQTRFMNAVGLDSTNSVDYRSDLLTPFQMWFLQCSLPDVYLAQMKQKEDDDNSRHWTPLYSSCEQGISVTRFEANVFDYRGPTVAIYRLSDNGLVALAVDQEWRNGGTMFGSVDTTFIELFPKLRRITKSSSVYCNFKLRNFPMKLSFGDDFVVDKEMSTVIAVEVFGCSGAHTLDEQRKLKDWQKRQEEKMRKVPLPGNWDENPDKFLLEVAGVYSTANRREIFNREEDCRP